MRLDLDPSEGADFELARAVAALCREVLAEHGLAGRPKTSGSRGIHIYVPIEPRWTFHEVRRASLALAREVERRGPGLATTEWWKEQRHGVFIDYNQNARDKTIASAYSVRHTGLVSAPFAWDELETIDPHALDLEAFAERWNALGDVAATVEAPPGRLDSPAGPGGGRRGPRARATPPGRRTIRSSRASPRASSPRSARPGRSDKRQ